MIFINVYVKLIDFFNYFNVFRGKGGSFYRYLWIVYIIVFEVYIINYKIMGLVSDFVG